MLIALYNIECLNGKDENCLSSWKTKIIVLLCAYLIVVMCWCYKYYKVYILMRSHAKQPEKPGIVNTAEPYFQTVKRQLSEEFPSEDISELKGDSAAHVKVSTYNLLQYRLWSFQGRDTKLEGFLATVVI